jgi:hypothetical protein
MSDMVMPAVGSVVNATVEHWYTKGRQQVELVRVDEGDCDWRTADDNSELDHNWNVVEWTDLD